MSSDCTPPRRPLRTAMPLLLAAILLPHLCTAVVVMVTNGFLQDNQNYQQQTILNLKGLDGTRVVTSVATVSNGKVNAELKISGMDLNAPETFATGLYMTVSNCHITAEHFMWIEFLPPNAYIHLYQTTCQKTKTRIIAIQTGWEFNTTVFIEESNFVHNDVLHGVRIFKPPSPAKHEFRDNCVLHIRDMTVYDNHGILSVADSPLLLYQQSALVLEDVKCMRCEDSVLNLEEFRLNDHCAFILRGVHFEHPKAIGPLLKAHTITVDETSLLSFVDIDISNGFKSTTSKALQITKIQGPGTIVFSRWLMQISGLATRQPVTNTKFWMSARSSAPTDLTAQELYAQNFNVNFDNVYNWDGTGADGTTCVPVGGGIPDRATYTLVDGKCVPTCDADYVPPACTSPATSQCQVPNCDLCYRITKTKCFVCASHTTSENDETLCRCPISECRVCPSATECTQCDLGYNVSTGGDTCIRCSIDVPKCFHCTTPSKCDQCEPYYNASADQKTCYECRIDNCLSCSAENVCAECAPQYNLTDPGKQNNRCMPCLLDNCALCGSDNNCQECAEGHTKPAGGTGDCVSCNVEHCERCDTANECAQCPDKHTADGTKHCYPCTMPGCLSCDGDEQCKECEDGYDLVGSTCIRCSIDVTNCKDCTAHGVCDQCEPYYNASADQKTCYECRIDNCLSCSADNVCARCVPQYNLTDAGKPSNRCTSCKLEHCALCGSDNNCQECAEGHTKPAGGTGDCVSCNVEHCERCDTANECAQCPDKHTADGTKHCYPCTMPGCQTCDGDEQCKECGDAYTLVGTTCVGCDVPNCDYCSSNGICAQCVAYYNVSADQKTCYECRIDNCLSCSADNVCARCVTQYNLTDAGKPSNRCTSCKLEHCALCGSDNDCQECAEGHTKPAGGTGDCVSCNVEHCERCDAENECAQCPDKYTTGAKHCYPCTMPGCQTCDGDEQCKECEEGYTLLDKKCVDCRIEGCAQCHEDGVCSACADGLSVAASGDECISCDIGNCTFCGAAGRCDACACGMVPADEDGEECVPCAAANCRHCDVESDGLMCAECVDGYDVSSSGACVKSGMPDSVLFIIVLIITIVAMCLFCLGVFLYLRHLAKLTQMELDAAERRRNRQAKGQGTRQRMDIGILDLGDIEDAASGVRDNTKNVIM